MPRKPIEQAPGADGRSAGAVRSEEQQGKGCEGLNRRAGHQYASDPRRPMNRSAIVASAATDGGSGDTEDQASLRRERDPGLLQWTWRRKMIAGSMAKTNPRAPVVARLLARYGRRRMPDRDEGAGSSAISIIQKAPGRSLPTTAREKVLLDHPVDPGPAGQPVDGDRLRPGRQLRAGRGLALGEQDQKRGRQDGERRSRHVDEEGGPPAPSALGTSVPPTKAPTMNHAGEQGAVGSEHSLAPRSLGEGSDPERESRGDRDRGGEALQHPGGIRSGYRIVAAKPRQPRGHGPTTMALRNQGGGRRRPRADRERAEPRCRQRERRRDPWQRLGPGPCTPAPAIGGATFGSRSGPNEHETGPEQQQDRSFAPAESRGRGRVDGGGCRRHYLLRRRNRTSTIYRNRWVYFEWRRIPSPVSQCFRTRRPRHAGAEQRARALSRHPRSWRSALRRRRWWSTPPRAPRRSSPAGLDGDHDVVLAGQPRDAGHRTCYQPREASSRSYAARRIPVTTSAPIPLVRPGPAPQCAQPSSGRPARRPPGQGRSNSSLRAASRRPRRRGLHVGAGMWLDGAAQSRHRQNPLYQGAQQQHQADGASERAAHHVQDTESGVVKDSRQSVAQALQEKVGLVAGVRRGPPGPPGHRRGRQPGPASCRASAPCTCDRMEGGDGSARPVRADRGDIQSVASRGADRCRPEHAILLCRLPVVGLDDPDHRRQAIVNGCRIFARGAAP